MGRPLPVPSTVIDRFDYDAATHTLTIRFVSGREYDYFDVPPRVHRDLKSRTSKGRYFNKRIRNAFRCRERS
jgi:hypothetical protein